MLVKICNDKGECEPACPRPVVIPDRYVPQSEAEKLWRQDRLSLVKCRNNHQAIADYYEALRKNLAGE